VTFDFSGQVAMVTGASRGIGLAVAEGFARSGARVAMLARDADVLAGAAAPLGERALAMPSDVTRADEVDAAVRQTLERFGRIDVLVNNAGLGLAQPTESVSLADWQRILDGNLTSAFYTSQVVGRAMQAAGRGGAIVNVGSLTTFLGVPGRAAYGAAKAAVAGLTRTLASEWGPLGIRVNCVAPGFIATQPLEQAIARGALDLEPLRRRTPLGRLGEPADMVGPVLFLASDAARFVTGVTLPVDGGWLVYGY
jgi:NAD(P)-dependent dehydrogenase (short-subunit alcohol dehydrogenase family)